jgi:hypothetical protein
MPEVFLNTFKKGERAKENKEASRNRKSTSFFRQHLLSRDLLLLFLLSGAHRRDRTFLLSLKGVSYRSSDMYNTLSIYDIFNAPRSSLHRRDLRLFGSSLAGDFGVLAVPSRRRGKTRVDK